MGRIQAVVTIGGSIVDVLETPDGSTTRHAGGAALNLAVGLARLDRPSALLPNLGRDPNGYWLRGYLGMYQVELIDTPNVDFTGVATS